MSSLAVRKISAI